ncbi:uncharacterized protein K02A2.6-like [Oncorhynchus keta]|uniref:uncharacterized protein K02A2.6-like n=1 Tax=Oncorhynchus keta TaxID=8018 RepID=UPI00227B9116|nr:uncharacterized protein K02A2.6-like [Oncorhynchus keta]
MTAARLQRYALFLASHMYDIEFKPSSLHTNADGLSRLPCTRERQRRVDAVDMFHTAQLEALPVTSTVIKHETRKDVTLSKVYTYTMSGWPATGRKERIPYFQRRNEITTYQGCLMWGMRVMIPQKCQHLVLQQLHEGHVGIVKMKLLARSHFWWPGLDQQIENMAKNCSGCLETLHMPAPVPVHPWEWPAEPRQRIHVDYAGPFEKHMFLVIVYAHSKWPEVFCTDSSTSAQTIECLRTTFARFGLPLQLVSDNAQAFVSDEFTRFMSVNGIKHSTSAPYHPATNRLAERFVQTLKQGLRAAKRDEGTLQTKLAKFLASYRNTPHATTNESPAALMFGRPLRTQLDIMKPNRRNEVLNKQAKMLSGGRERHLQTGQEVMVRDYRRGKWTRGTVHTQTGPRTYQVQKPSRHLAGHGGLANQKGQRYTELPVA